MKKVAIIVLSDPKAGSDESFGRVFNALASAHEFKQKGDDVTILLMGAGTRWAAELSKAGHPAHELYEAVRDRLAGASCACAEAFGAKAEVEQCGLPLLCDNAVPGTMGLPSLRRLVGDGYTILAF